MSMAACEKQQHRNLAGKEARKQSHLTPACGLQAQGTAAEQQVLQQLQQRYSPQAVQAMMALSSSSSGNSSRRAFGNEAAVVAEVPGSSSSSR
jgi:hypothetical protein